MKIYVLFYNDWDGSSFLGAFSTEEKADEFRKKFYPTMKDWSIEKYVVDPKTDIP